METTATCRSKKDESMRDWTVNDFMKAFHISREKAKAWYDAWQCDEYTVK